MTRAKKLKLGSRRGALRRPAAGAPKTPERRRETGRAPLGLRAPVSVSYIFGAVLHVLGIRFASQGFAFVLRAQLRSWGLLASRGSEAGHGIELERGPKASSGPNLTFALP